MEPIIVWYLRMSVVYLAAGALFGVGMVLWPGEAGYYISAHAHLNLLGFMSMMIYGVGYHILPRFSGRTVYSPLLVRVQFWFANAGIIGMALAWPLMFRDSLPGISGPVFITSVFCSFIAVVLFTVNVLKTIKPA